MDGMREVRWAREVGVRSIACSRVAKWSETVGCDRAFELERRKEATRAMCWRRRVGTRKEGGDASRATKRRGTAHFVRSSLPPTSAPLVLLIFRCQRVRRIVKAKLFYIRAAVQRDTTPILSPFHSSPSPSTSSSSSPKSNESGNQPHLPNLTLPPSLSVPPSTSTPSASSASRWRTEAGPPSPREEIEPVEERTLCQGTVRSWRSRRAADQRVPVVEGVSGDVRFVD